MLKILVIIGSTRPGRKGPSIAAWIYERAKQVQNFDVQLVDLAEINLPFLDEPNHPMQKRYTQPHTKDWSELIDSADGFILVTPEYNFGLTAPVKNAIDYLYHEWTYKPIAFVSYGGVAAGTRSVQMLKLVVTTLKMTPLSESVNIPFFTKFIDKDNNFIADDILNKSADLMFNEFEKWTESLKELRLKK